eukprot:TRINITY_DN2862_c0_g1::TRINITY_DN2862_c0_g1_i13::g.6333::m.6333 TRINITY_DN2862_c0_g1::TRINITY_DN2862_c0_g1_i13::g.6333  ORF type:complete len:171 (-),score=42.83,ATP-synt_B/PF00430.13/0.34,ATP-synt_B/PF00430.13/1.3e+02,DUF4629/PF15442.1/0.46,COG2/PF06148.6/58,COG2/PF06148.6/4,XhlA/PF10779.4/1.5e+02,XhlA/PF10779.4/2.8 TRINITY_DN2862_c0_g1_i13:103-543(-)
MAHPDYRVKSAAYLDTLESHSHLQALMKDVDELSQTELDTGRGGMWCDAQKWTDALTNIATESKDKAEREAKEREARARTEKEVCVSDREKNARTAAERGLEAARAEIERLETKLKDSLAVAQAEKDARQHAESLLESQQVFAHCI